MPLQELLSAIIQAIGKADVIIDVAILVVGSLEVLSRFIINVIKLLKRK